jgi:hypothetical protein
VIEQKTARCSDLSDKDSGIDDFLTTLKVAFKTATMYNMDHPAFQKVVADLMAKIKTVQIIKALNPQGKGKEYLRLI